MRFRVTYARAADLVADAEQQFARGGLLVALPPPAGVDRGTAVELDIVSPHGEARLAATVIAPLPGAGVAVAFDTADAALRALVATARKEPQSDDGAPPRFELVTEPAAYPRAATGVDDEDAIELGPPIELDLEPGLPASAAGALELDVDGPDDGPPGTLELDLASDTPDAGDGAADDGADGGGGGTGGMTPDDGSMAAKIQRALYGDRNDRLASLRDTNRALHSYALRNAGIQLDEIVWVAKQATVSAELLTYIAGRREWVQRPEIASALVRNPKTPPPLAIKLLDLVAPAELRMLAKQTSVRDIIQRAARKKLLGG